MAILVGRDKTAKEDDEEDDGVGGVLLDDGCILRIKFKGCGAG